MKIDHVLETCLYVDDLDSAEHFYKEILGLQLMSRVAGRHVFFRCKNQVLLIFDADETQKGGDLPAHGCKGQGHIAFSVKNDTIPHWIEYLSSHGIEIEKEMTWGDRGKSIYFRDPSGNSLELATPRIWSIEEDDIF